MIPTPRRSTPDARRAANRLVDELQRERTAGRAAPAPAGLAPRGNGIGPAHIEQAKGALMLHLGVDSHEAFAVLLGWARTAHTPVSVIARTLLHGTCSGSPRPDAPQRSLSGWLEAQLRDIAPDHPPLGAGRSGGEAATQTPRGG